MGNFDIVCIFGLCADIRRSRSLNGKMVKRFSSQLGGHCNLALDFVECYVLLLD